MKPFEAFVAGAVCVTGVLFALIELRECGYSHASERIMSPAEQRLECEAYCDEVGGDLIEMTRPADDTPRAGCRCFMLLPGLE